MIKKKKKTSQQTRNRMEFPQLDKPSYSEHHTKWWGTRNFPRRGGTREGHILRSLGIWESQLVQQDKKGEMHVGWEEEIKLSRLALWRSMRIWVLVRVLDAPLPIQLPGDTSGKEAQMLDGVPDSWLHSSSPSPRCSVPWNSELVDGRSVSISPYHSSFQRNKKSF